MSVVVYPERECDKTDLALPPSPAVGTTHFPEISARLECGAIQGTGKHADVCCAAKCECTCEEDSSDTDDSPGCNIAQIRQTTVDFCTEEEDTTEACALAPG